jgi:hypothetical protein
MSHGLASRRRGLRDWGYMTMVLGARGAAKHCCGTAERLHPSGFARMCVSDVSLDVDDLYWEE